MDILSKYLSLDYLMTFFMTLLIFTFVMCIGVVIKAIDLLARGVSGVIMFHYLMRSIPYSLTFAIPMSALTTVLLLFSRLSLDGEITAMRACGLTIWQIVAGPVLLSILLSGSCVYLNAYAAPNSHYAQRALLKDVGMEEPVNLLEERRFVKDFPGAIIYVGKKDGRKIRDVIVYQSRPDGSRTSVRAESGIVTPDPSSEALLVDLFDVVIEIPDSDFPNDPSRNRTVRAKKHPVKLEFDKMWEGEQVRKKRSDMTIRELVDAVRNIHAAFPDLPYKELLRQRMAMVVEANERLALSLSCFAFTLLGIPLGMRSKRRESSVGVAISLGLVFVFYLFIIVADSLVDHPDLHPDLIIWAPVVLAEIGGFWLLRRQN